MKKQYSIYELFIVTTCVGFILCGIVSFDIGPSDVPPLVRQLFTHDHADHWTGVYVETTGRAVLLGVACGSAVVTVLVYLAAKRT